MADPRDDVIFDGIEYEAITIPHDDTIVYDAEEVGGSAQVGLAVSLESSKLVTLAGNGENIYGRLNKVEPDGYAVVQYRGYVKLPGGDTATLTPGTKIVGDLGAASAEGYIQSVSTQDTVSRGVIIDASDPTEVVVYLE